MWEANWLKPVWENGLIFRETFTMIRENGICSAVFLYQPDEVIRVESYDGSCSYEEGKDYIVQDGKLVLPQDSRIPCTTWDTFYHGTEAEAAEALANNRIPLGFGPIATTDGRYLNLSAIAFPEYITDWQVAVTYKTSEQWQGPVPQFAEEKLPRTIGMLKNKKEIKIALYGDSISYGFDCSGMYEREPNQPRWCDLLKTKLEEVYGVNVTLENLSLSGMDTDWAIEHAEELVVPHNPDLIILGYGMNDRCTGAEYVKKTETLRAILKQNCPDAEYILIATSLPNVLTHTAPFWFDAYQREHAEYLNRLEETGSVIADIQGIQSIMEQRKRYIDLTGNNLNHPNDYLARIYAQVIAALLTEKK